MADIHDEFAAMKEFFSDRAAQSAAPAEQLTFIKTDKVPEGEFVHFSAMPEDVERCKECGDVSLTWFIDSAIWNKVVPERSPILCMPCFIERAERSGINPTGWELVPEGSEAKSPFAVEAAALRTAQLERELHSCDCMRVAAEADGRRMNVLDRK